MAATTTQLGLVTPTQGDLSGTWGNTVNNGITEYTNIAIAGTTTFNGDGAVTLVNTTGDASATNIASTSAQYMIVRVTGTLTTAKIITFGSAGSAPYSKLYLVDNAATGGIVTFKAYGQTGVSVAVGEKALVFYNGTDIVKVAGTTSGAAGGSNTQVQYNSSGALAGSANLTFDGTTLTGTASGAIAATFNRTTSSGATVKVQVVGNDVGTLGSDTGGQGRLDIASVAAMQLRATGASSYISFDANNAEGMRLTSTGLGIGTSSPLNKLQIKTQTNGNAGFANSTSVAGGVKISCYNDAGSASSPFEIDGSTLQFNIASTERMRLDSAGNLGLGVTPSAWSATWKAFQTTGGSFVGATSNIRMAQNWYNDGTSRYVATRPASMFVADDGIFAWYQAPSGTAGNAISFTQAMTLDASGNLGIGTSSPSARLHISGTTDATQRIIVNGSGNTSSYKLNYNGSEVGFIQNYQNTEMSIGTTVSAWLGFNTNNTERARISAAGGFSVGTTADPGAGAIYATGNITAYYSSDIKFKENVRDIPDALATVNAIGGKLFDWKDDYIESKGGADGYFVQKADFGVVAQDVQKVFPIAVRTREDGSLAVDYEKLGALAFAALVELTKRVEALESK
jgi:hypothetical protein